MVDGVCTGSEFQADGAETKKAREKKLYLWCRLV